MPVNGDENEGVRNTLNDGYVNPNVCEHKFHKGYSKQ